MTTKTTIADAELLPCPFCGSTEVKTFGPYGWYHQWGISHSCKSFYSGAQEMFQGFPNEAEAIAAWNHRTHTNPPSEERIEQVATIIDPHSFCDIPFTDDPILLQMVEQSKADALRKAERIIAALEAADGGEMREALDWFVKHERSITNDISSAHSGRGAAASEWMREDDSDFRDDLREAFDKARAALAKQEPR